VLIGEVIGRYVNDAIMTISIRRNNGVFEPESRLWYVLILGHRTDPKGSSSLYSRTCYIAIPLYICGFVLLGASFQNGLGVGALIMGWGIAEVAIMINTVAICK
jgi:hypothetical protein